MHVVYVIAPSRTARLRLSKLVRAAAGGPPTAVTRNGVTGFACPSETWRAVRADLRGVAKAARLDGWTPAMAKAATQPPTRHGAARCSTTSS